MSANSNIEEKVMELDFKQSSFVIDKIIKNALKESPLPPDQPLTLKASKNYGLSLVDGNKTRVMLKLSFIGDMALTSDESVIFRFLEVTARAEFELLSEAVDIDKDEILQKMLLIQTNVQLTDFINQLILTSELKGSKIPYDA